MPQLRALTDWWRERPSLRDMVQAYLEVGTQAASSAPSGPGTELDGVPSVEQLKRLATLMNGGG